MDGCVVISLFRHGMTAENERGAYIGWTDSPLSEQGRMNIHSIQLEIPKPDLVFSSDLIRCQETAAIFFPNQPVLELREFREINFGHWEGKTYTELNGRKDYQLWLDSPFTAGPDGGETFAAFTERVGYGFVKMRELLFSTGSREIAVVTHGGVIRSLLTQFSAEERSFFDWKVAHGSGYRMCWTLDGIRRDEPCISLQEVPITEKPIG